MISGAIAGNIFRTSRITTGISQADKTGAPYSRYYQIDKGVYSITQYGKGGIPRYRIDVKGTPHFIKKINKSVLPHIHTFGIYKGNVYSKPVREISYILWLILGNWR